MTQLSTWGKAWGQAWGDSWGKLEESTTGKSGVQRLWMYELYAKAIEEDKKKREPIAEIAPPVTPTQTKPLKQGKPKRHKGRTRPIEQKPATKPLPVLPRVFTPPENTAILDQIIASVTSAPLPRLPVLKRKEKVVVHEAVNTVFEDEDELEFLLLAA